MPRRTDISKVLVIGHSAEPANRRCATRFSLFLIVCYALSLPDARACIKGYPYFDVPTRFVAVVGSEGILGVGVEVSLEANDYPARVVRRAYTDQYGNAAFEGVVPGEYRLRISHPLGAGSAAMVRVSPVNGKSVSEVPLKWPGTDPFKARSIRGHLSEWGVSGYANNYLLELFTAKGDSPIASALVDQDGEFNFGSAQPAGRGLFFIRVHTWVDGSIHETIGDFPVVLSPKVSIETLDLQFSLSTCGLHVARRIPCEKEKVLLRQAPLRGQVVDWGEAVVPGATVELFASDNRVFRTQTNATGRFELPPLQGEFLLRIQKDGLPPVTARIFLTNGRKETDRLLLADFGGVGTCGSVKVAKEELNAPSH